MNPTKRLFALSMSLACFGAASLYAESVTIEVNTPGTLKHELGESLNSVTELTVKGTVNEDDFRTMWECGFYGNCRVLDLSDATIENGRQGETVPPAAFFREDVQGDPARDSFKPIKTERIILPDNTYIIGPKAFKGVTLKEFRMPHGLVYIFDEAFAYSRIESADLSDTRLEIIHANAFSHSDLSEVSLPACCAYYGKGCFDYCASLRKITMRGTISIHGSIASHGGLERIDFIDTGNNTIDHLPSNAFGHNRNLHELNIARIVKSVHANAFEGSGLRRVMFEGGTLLHTGSFTGFPELTEIYCKSATPPATTGTDGAQQYPFGGTTPKTATVYVPVGCADTYRNTEGWNYFTNFVEITEFPVLGAAQTLTDMPAATFAKAVDGGILISGEGVYSVCTVDGVAVAHGEASGTVVKVTCGAGIYVVSLCGKSQKILVR